MSKWLLRLEIHVETRLSHLQLWMVEHLVCGSYEDRSKVRESWRAVAHPPSLSYVERTLRPVTVRI